MSTSPRTDPDRADRFVSGVGDYLLRLPQSETSGAELKALREARGITQVELAKRLGSEQTHISRIERGENQRLATILAYLHALEATDLELRATFPDGAQIALPLPTNN
jgi:transcriptional regulator with XRE-family HTH domain